MSVTIKEFAALAGCDQKQVQRALKAGKLAKLPDGGMDPKLALSGWRRQDRRTLGRAATDTKKVSAPPAAAPISDIKDSLARKEAALAALKELELEQQRGKLVEVEVARRHYFELARAARDSWLNWPSRVAPLIAAELGIEGVDRLTDLLNEHVGRNIDSLSGDVTLH